MPDVAFKDLCIDVTVDATAPANAGEGAELLAAIAGFWSVALGQPVDADDGDGISLAPSQGGSENHRVWINDVPEPIAGKSRVHIDVRVADGDPAPLIAAGGTLQRPADDEIGWNIVTDPDGVAVCVFGPHPADPTALGPFELVVDAVDPPAIAAWWAARTGGTVGGRDGAPFVWIEGAAGFPYMFWVFHHVPEPKTAKNRVHWDVTLVDATVDDLVAAGATLLQPKGDGSEIDWHVMADPEGNEFCAFD
jgi:hypothetical protein